MPARACAALALVVFVPLAAEAASPASGTLTTTQRTLTYSAGPFAAPNTSAPSNPACDAAHPCDDFALTLDVPMDYRVTHPRDLLFVSAKWPVNNFTAYALYVIDAGGTVVDYKLTELDPVVVSIPAAPGRYTLRLVPQQGSPDILNVTVKLLADPTGGRAAGPAPRYSAVPTPPGMGDRTGGGEMNIGYNPITKRAMSLSFLQTMRTTFPDTFDPPLPECCDALWEDKSDSRSNQNTNDPILVTDAQTGRTFVSQLQAGTPGESIFLYTDDDGDSWTLSPSTMNGGIDHQSVGVGPYAAAGTAAPRGAYPNAVYYCSQSIVAAFCIRSDDGGDTFTRPSVLVTAADCDGYTPYIHGHVRVAPDGTAYVPERNCGGFQAAIVSEDSGDSWETRRLPETTSGDNDSSIGIASDGTVYYCYLSGDGHPHVAVSKDRGRTWINDRDIGHAQGIEHAVFPNAVAGDSDRAACAFLGTRTPGPFQSAEFTGLWHVYVATTYDGGETWHTVDALPDDPVQGEGGICLGGTTCIENRNLLDFNEITMDEQGRVLYGFNDGCVGDCVLTGKPNQIALPTFVNIITDIFLPGVVPGEVFRLNIDAKPTILRQVGGRPLLAAYDPPAVAPPKAACLAGGRDLERTRLVWKAPDHNGDDIVGYNVYRGLDPDAMVPIGSTGPTVFYDDTAASPLVVDYYYKVTALNARGEGVASNVVRLAVGTLPDRPNSPPVARLSSSPASGAPGVSIAFDAAASTDGDGDALIRYAFDFGDGSDVVTQAGPAVEHRYDVAGTYRATVKVVDARGNRSQNAGTVEIVVSDVPPQPDAFAFVPRSNVATAVFVTSEAKTLTGFGGSLAIAVANGQYSLDGGSFTAAAGRVSANQTLRVRHLSASTPGTLTETGVEVGGYATVFQSTTGVDDRTPDAFQFATQTGVERATGIVSDVIRPGGFSTAVPVQAGPGSAYRINAGTWTTAPGTVNPGDSVETRHTSAAQSLTYTKTYLKIGGVVGYFTTRTR